MKGAIASVELFAWARPAASSEQPRRLTLVVGAPFRERGEEVWTCRVALADLKRPVELSSADSFGALSAALAQGESWLDELCDDGIVFTRDRAGLEPYPRDAKIVAGGTGA